MPGTRRRTFERRETRVKFDPSDEPRDRGSRWDFDDEALKASVDAEPRLTVGGIVERLASPICARFIVAWEKLGKCPSSAILGETSANDSLRIS